MRPKWRFASLSRTEPIPARPTQKRRELCAGTKDLQPTREAVSVLQALCESPYDVASKTAIGSSTVAILTTAGLLSPLLGTLGLASPLGRVFAVLAIGAGAMTVSHANDSHFWIITEFSDMETATAYRVWTLATLTLGLVSIVWILIVKNVSEMVF